MRKQKQTTSLDVFSSAQTEYNLEAIQPIQTARISAIDNLTAWCGWINNLAKLKYALVTCMIGGTRHRLIAVDKYNDYHVRVRYLSYDNTVFEAVDVAEVFCIEAKYREVLQ